MPKWDVVGNATGGWMPESLTSQLPIYHPLIHYTENKRSRQQASGTLDLLSRLPLFLSCTTKDQPD